MIIHPADAVTQMPSCHRVEATRDFSVNEAHKPADIPYIHCKDVAQYDRDSSQKIHSATDGIPQGSHFEILFIR